MAPVPHSTELGFKPRGEFYIMGGLVIISPLNLYHPPPRVP
uniref:Pco080890 n=1 Tax=Arundo donax TaxID=35708 RepID=A0A0A9D4S2_ARUDO